MLTIRSRTLWFGEIIAEWGSMRSANCGKSHLSQVRTPLVQSPRGLQVANGPRHG